MPSMLSCSSCALLFSESDLGAHVESRHVGPRPARDLFLVQCGDCEFTAPEYSIQTMMRHCYDAQHDPETISTDWQAFQRLETERIIKLLKMGVSILETSNLPLPPEEYSGIQPENSSERLNNSISYAKRRKADPNVSISGNRDARRSKMNIFRNTLKRNLEASNRSSFQRRSNPRSTGAGDIHPGFYKEPKSESEEMAGEDVSDYTENLAIEENRNDDPSARENIETLDREITLTTLANDELQSRNANAAEHSYLSSAGEQNIEEDRNVTPDINHGKFRVVNTGIGASEPRQLDSSQNKVTPSGTKTRVRCPMSRMSMEQREKLILEVRARPELWNRSMTEFPTQKDREIAWGQVSEALGMGEDKRYGHTLQERYDIISAYERRESPTQIMARFGVKRDTFYTIIRKRDRVKKLLEEGIRLPSARRVRFGKLEPISKDLIIYTKSCIEQNIPVTGEGLLNKAKELAEAAKCSQTPNMGWIQRWRVRQGFVMKRVHDETSNSRRGYVCVYDLADNSFCKSS